MCHLFLSGLENLRDHEHFSALALDSIAYGNYIEFKYELIYERVVLLGLILRIFTRKLGVLVRATVLAQWWSFETVGSSVTELDKYRLQMNDHADYLNYILRGLVNGQLCSNVEGCFALLAELRNLTTTLYPVLNVNEFTPLGRLAEEIAKISPSVWCPLEFSAYYSIQDQYIFRIYIHPLDKPPVTDENWTRVELTD